jgi:hypothetical protein
MALTPEQIAYNRLPYDEQQKQNAANKVKDAIAFTGGNSNALYSGNPLSYADSLRNRPATDPIAANLKVNTSYQSPAQVVSNATGKVDYSNYAKNSSANGIDYSNYAKDSMAVGTKATGTVNPVNDYQKGMDDATKKYEDRLKGLQTAEQATKINEDARAAEAEAIRAKVRAAIAEGVNSQNKIISDAPAQFVNPMNNASYQGMKNLDSIKEAMAQRGRYFSGDMDQAQMVNANQTAANINDLENTKAKIISNAQAEIARLQASGSLQEVQMVQEAARASLDRLQNQINAIDTRTNDQATALFNSATNALKTSYDIGSNEKQLGMQQQNIDNSVNQFDKTFNANEFWKNKEYNQQQAQQTWENAYKNNAFDYQKERNNVADSQWGKQYQQQVDEFVWQKNPNNPNVKSQIIENNIKDLQLGYMQDPNSPENQTRMNQAKVIKQQLDQLIAISPEMKVKEFNAGLDKIYQDIEASKANVRQGDRQLDIEASKASASGTRAQKQSAYFGDVSKNIDNFVGNLNDNGLIKNLTMPGSVEHRNFVVTIDNAMKNGLITPDEGEYFFNYYNVPFQFGGNTQQQQQQQPKQSNYMNSISGNNIPSEYQLTTSGQNATQPKIGFGGLNRMVR